MNRCAFLNLLIKPANVVSLISLFFFFMLSVSPAIAGRWIKAYGGNISGEDFQEAWGVNPEFFNSYFMENEVLNVQMVSNNVPANILWPEDELEITLQLTNLTDQPIQKNGEALVIQYSTFTYPDFVAHLGVKKIADAGSQTVSINVPANGYQNITIHPPIPEKFGGYTVILDFPGQDRLFANACIRTFRSNITRRKYHQLTMDLRNEGEIPALVRLGAPPNRIPLKYMHTGHEDFDAHFKEITDHLEELNEANLSTTLEFSGLNIPEMQPLGMTRPWLDENGVMQEGKRDFAWLPEYDPDFQEFVYRILREYGWPKGPVNGVMLWNEPWEGTSISGWKADIPRYRSMYKHMALATEKANREENLDVMIGGCDSYPNTMDKLFADGTDEFLKWFDFLSLHYTGLSSYSTVKKFLNKRGPDGEPQPVVSWDTESWIANSDERIPGVLSGMLAANFQKVVGVMGRGVVTSTQQHRIQTGEGSQKKDITYCWSAGVSIGAFRHFIGNREFEHLLFQNGLPWVMVFKGLPDQAGVPDPEDGSVVVVGNMGQLFNEDAIPFRSVRSLAELRFEDSLRNVLDGLPADATEQRAELNRMIHAQDPYAGAYMKVDAGKGAFQMYDMYGNEIEPERGQYLIPLNTQGYYLRGNGKTGSFQKLIEALHDAEIKGLEVLATECRDMTRPLDQHAVIEIKLTNVMNRKLQGALSIEAEQLNLSYPEALSFQPHETKIIEAEVVSGQPTEDNVYHLSLDFQGDDMLQASHEEDMHVNWISRKTITVDGKLDDWDGALPQIIVQEGSNAPSFEEYAQRPFLEYDRSFTKGVSTAYLGYDEHYFYFAAKIADESKDDGMPRFNERDDDQFFYPDTAYMEQDGELLPLVWPEGVRKYTYRSSFMLPSGQTPNKDNVLLGFNVVTPKNEPWHPHPEGIMKGFSNFWDTDYEFALNKVSGEHGGGHEIWKLRVPGMPPKSFYPRQGKSAMDGPVEEGRLMVKYTGNTRIVECALPWSAIPLVKQRLDNNEPIKFSYRVNDNSGVGTMELAKDRSVSSFNKLSFHDFWKEHWANSLEFGWEGAYDTGRE